MLNRSFSPAKLSTTISLVKSDGENLRLMMKLRRKIFIMSSLLSIICRLFMLNWRKASLLGANMVFGTEKVKKLKSLCHLSKNNKLTGFAYDIHQIIFDQCFGKPGEVGIF